MPDFTGFDFHGRLPSKCEPEIPRKSGISPLSVFSEAASNSAKVTVFEPSFQLKVMVSLSSYRKIELTKMSTIALR